MEKIDGYSRGVGWKISEEGGDHCLMCVFEEVGGKITRSDSKSDDLANHMAYWYVIRKIITS